MSLRRRKDQSLRGFRLLWNAFVQRAMNPAPLAVMAYASLEKALDPDLLNDLFDPQADRPSTRILLLSDLVDLMAQVVWRTQPSLRQAYLQQPRMLLCPLGRPNSRVWNLRLLNDWFGIPPTVWERFWTSCHLPWHRGFEATKCGFSMAMS
jgi:hypothetical protein